MATPTIRRQTFTIASGKHAGDYPVVINHRAMCMIEDLTGRNLLLGLSILDLGISHTRTMLYCAMQAAAKLEGKPLPFTLDEFDDMLTPDDYGKMVNIISAAFSDAIPAAEKGAEGGDPLPEGATAAVATT